MVEQDSPIQSRVAQNGVEGSRPVRPEPPGPKAVPLLSCFPLNKISLREGGRGSGRGRRRERRRGGWGRETERERERRKKRQLRRELAQGRHRETGEQALAGVEESKCRTAEVGG